MKIWLRVLLGLLLPVFLYSFVFAENLVKQGRGRYATRKIKLETELSDSQKIKINSVESVGGKLYIVAAKKEQAQIEFRKLFKTDDEEKANEYTEIVQVVFKETSSGLELLIQAPNPSPWSGSDKSVSIEGELNLPEGSMVVIDAMYFDIIVDGPFRSVKNVNSFGRLDVKHITEKTVLSTSHGNISVKDLSGDISIETENADIRAYQVAASDKPAQFINKNGDVILNGCMGGLSIKNSYGKVRAEDISTSGQKISIDCDYTPVFLALDELDSAVVSITNVNEDISIDFSGKLSAVVDLQVDADSEIHVEGMPIKPDDVEPRRIEFETGSGDNRISAKIKGIGDITFQGSK